MTELSSNGVVAHDVEGGIAWVKFNRPDKRNCMSPTLNRDMMEVLDALEFRDDVGVLVLTGEGTAWSAGMDLKEYFRETEAGGLGAVRQAQRESYGWWRRLSGCGTASAADGGRPRVSGKGTEPAPMMEPEAIGTARMRCHAGSRHTSTTPDDDAPRLFT